VASFKRFAIVLTFLTILGFSTIYLFDVFMAMPIDIPLFLRQTLRIILILGFWLLILYLLHRSKPVLTAQIGAQAASVVQITLQAVAIIIAGFGVLHTLGVAPEALLTGAGIVTITIE